jgi:hypothetical protein
VWAPPSDPTDTVKSTLGVSSASAGAVRSMNAAMRLPDHLAERLVGVAEDRAACRDRGDSKALRFVVTIQFHRTTDVPRFRTPQSSSGAHRELLAAMGPRVERASSVRARLPQAIAALHPERLVAIALRGAQWRSPAHASRPTGLQDLEQRGPTSEAS